LSGAGSRLGSRSASTVVAGLAIFTMGPLILLSTLSVNSFYATVTDASNQKLAGASALAGIYVDTEMSSLSALDTSEAHQASLVGALRDGNHANFDNPVILSALKNLRAQRPDTMSAAIVDTTGTYWGNQDPPTPASFNGMNVSSTRDWYQGVTRTGRTYVSSAFASAAQGAPLIVAIAAPITADGVYAPKDYLIGYLVVGYALSSTQRLFSDFARNQGMLIEVTDQRGVVVAQSGPTPTKLVADNSPGVAAALTGTSSVGRISLSGEDNFAAYSPVLSIGWTLVARQPATVALADADRLRANVVALTVILLVLLGVAKLILFVLLRERQATHAALALANTGLAARVATRTADLETSNQKLGRRSAELEASNRELEAFGYSVSHDLRSPLRSIDGFSRLVLEENASELSAEGIRRLGLVRAGAQQMGILIDDLLSFSRLGRVELKKRRVNTADMVNEVIAELRQENPDRQIEFVVQVLPACLADPVLLKQVFRNLLGNAVKFSRTRPDARIEIGSDASMDAAKPGMVLYFIKDNGVGFDMHYVDKLFGVFQRLHRMEDFPGTGVGLALIRRIVERHGGKVWAEGVVDSGATFYLTLEDGNARA
jgi:signal transduction histidine kinase